MEKVEKVMFKKVADLTVKVGSYEKNGETKGRYENCGMVLKDDDGKKMIMINPRFNFAGVKLEEGRDFVIVSSFEVKEKESKQEPDWDE